MDITERKVGNVNIVVLGGRLDILASKDLEEKLDPLLDADRVCLVVSLDQLDYISSSGLRVLLASLKKVRKREGDIKLACVKPSVKEIFDIAGFSPLFSIYDVEDVAVEAFNKL